MGPWLAPLALALAVSLSQDSDGTFTMTLTDGTSLRGPIQIPRLELTTDFGHASVDTAALAHIAFGKPPAQDVVETRDGHTLRGRVALKRLRIRTEEHGVRAIPRERIDTLTADHADEPGGPSWTGSWSGTFGPMTLVQTGSQIAGTSGYEDETTLEGTVRGNTCELTWTASSGRGTATWTLWDDGQTFTGTSEGSGNSSFWGGYRCQPDLPKPTPGEVVSGQTTSTLHVHLRVPEAWDGTTEFPAIAFFHGSNMTSRDYVESIAAAWPQLAKEYVLVGLDGEKLSSASKPGRRVFNATYVNFSGHEVWHRFAYRQTPALAAEALQELQEAMPITRWIIGGHSQGGFLSYAVAFFYPDLVAGAFPMSCGLLVQCDPDAFEEDEVRTAQRSIPIAVVHGQADQVVAYTSGQYIHERLLDGDFPMLRAFSPERVGHAFVHLPVENAVRWIESFLSDDADELLATASEAWDDGRSRDAAAALQRYHAIGGPPAHAALLAAALDAELAPTRDALLDAITRNEDGTWVESFWDFRRQYGPAPGAAPVLDAYARLREEHADAAQRAVDASRSADSDEARQRQYRLVLDEFYACRWWPVIRRWAGEDS